MNQRRIKYRPSLPVIGMLFALGIGLASAGLLTSGALARLMSGDTQASTAPQDAHVQALQSSHQALTELQRSLQRLSAPATRNAPQPHRAGPEHLQTLLAGLSVGRTDRLAVETGPSIAGSINRRVTQHDAASFIARVAVDLNRIERDLGTAARRKDTPEIDVAMLDSALRRFDRVSGPVVNDTFARVYLGLSEMVPRLSDSGAYHPRVAKADLRAQVIEERTAEARFAAASRAASPTLLTT
ncbi:MAG: hypothetical protein WBM65_07330, partial [Sedimenticolaceae bacterium]